MLPLCTILCSLSRNIFIFIFIFLWKRLTQVFFCINNSMGGVLMCNTQEASVIGNNQLTEGIAYVTSLMSVGFGYATQTI